jgi:hypothetical protein
MTLQNCPALFIFLGDFSPTFCSLRLWHTSLIESSRVESSGVVADSATRRQFQSPRFNSSIVSELTEEFYSKRKIGLALRQLNEFDLIRLQWLDSVSVPVAIEDHLDHKFFTVNIYSCLNFIFSFIAHTFDEKHCSKSRCKVSTEMFIEFFISPHTQSILIFIVAFWVMKPCSVVNFY